MANQQLLDYIKQQLQEGIDREQIERSLITNGWQPLDIEEGFKSTSISDHSQNYSNILDNKQSANLTKSNKKLIIAIIVIFILLVGSVSAYYFRADLPVIKNFISKNTAQYTVNESPVIGNSNTPNQRSIILPENPENKNCDNYQCLISAAAQCQPISATISYSNIPFPFNPDIFVAGKTQYEIKKSSDASDCILIFSSPETTFSLSEKGRQAALEQGMTDAEIIAQLQTMNSSVDSEIATKSQTTCSSNADAIVAYLTDVTNGTQNVLGDGQIVTYTTSAGQKLICMITLPTGQSSNDY